MVRPVHALAPADVPPGYPLPPCESFPWWRFDELLAEVGDGLDDAARAGIEAVGRRTTAVGRHGRGEGRVPRRRPPGNVVMTADGPVLSTGTCSASARRRGTTRCCCG